MYYNPFRNPKKCQMLEINSCANCTSTRYVSPQNHNTQCVLITVPMSTLGLMFGNTVLHMRT